MMWSLVAAALAPVILLFIYILIKDMRQPEPLVWLLKALCYGVISALLVIIVMSAFGEMEVTSWVTGFLKAFVQAGIPEESAKLLMLWLLLRKNPYYDERLDGIVYASCIGLGFAGFENIGYLMQGLEDGSWISIGVSRALFAVPGHFFFGVVMGFFFGLGTFGDPAKRKRNMFLAWFMPMMAHGLYDGVLMSMGAMPEYVAGIMLIVFLWGFNRLRKYSVKLISKHQNEIV